MCLSAAKRICLGVRSRHRSTMRAAVQLLWAATHLTCAASATEVTAPSGIPWCVDPSAYVEQTSELCSEDDTATFDTSFLTTSPPTWCEFRNVLSTTNLKFSDSQFNCYVDDPEPEGSACMPLPYSGHNAVCADDTTYGHVNEQAHCTEVLDGALLGGDAEQRQTIMTLTTASGRVVLVNLNRDETDSFQATTSGGALDGFGASQVLLADGSIGSNLIWGAEPGSSTLMFWSAAPGSTMPGGTDSTDLHCAQVDVGGAIEATVALPLESGGLAIGVLLTKDTSTPNQAVMHFYEAPWSSCATGSAEPQRRATWAIALDASSSGTMRLKALRHYRPDLNADELTLNVKCFPAEAGSVRYLVMLFDDKHVALYHYDHFDVATSATPNDLQLSFGASDDQSLFFTAPEGRVLTGATGWGSCTANEWDSILLASKSSAQTLWLATVTETGDVAQPSPILEVRALAEFGRAQTHCLLADTHFGPLSDAGYRASNPAWQCSDGASAACCYSAGVSRCVDADEFIDSSGMCVPRFIMNGTNHSALGLPIDAHVIDLATGLQTVNEGAWQNYDLSSSTSSYESTLSSLGLTEQVSSLTNITNTSTNASSTMSRLNTASCGLQPCSIDDELYHVLFVATNKRAVKVVALQESLCRGNGGADDTMNVVALNEVYLPGDPIKVLVSPNAQHLFPIQQLRKWQLDSRERFQQLCKNASDAPDDPYFEPWTPVCDSGLTKLPINIWDFLSYFSVCRQGTSCPSLVNPNSTDVARGEFTARPVQNAGACPRGYFCIAGLRNECLPGFVCPEANMTFPQRCKSDSSAGTTCYQTALTEPQMCPSGFACISPASEPWGAAPGFYFPDYPRDTLYECPGGEWCPWMAYNESNTTDGGARVDQDTRCPDNFYCIEPSVIKPEQCFETNSEGEVNRSSIMYCPKGTQFPEYCPAGYHCRTPNVSKACDSGYYCPPGSALQDLCPAGTYCPTPNISITCPAGHFCRIGVIEAKKCFPNAHCPTGSEFENNILNGIIFSTIIVSIVGAALGLQLSLRERRMRQLKLTLEIGAEVKRAKKILKEADHLLHARAKEKKRLERAAARKSGRIELEEGSIVNDAAHGHGAAHEGISLRLFKQYVVFPFQVALRPPPMNLAEIGFVDLSLTVLKTGKRVLNNVNGVIRPAQLTAIMGPSGSGKTSFMTTLAGRAHYGNMSGEVLLNGEHINPKSNEYQSKIGFVPQNDIMHPNLTVFETLLYTARIRQPFSLRRTEQLRKVNQTIGQLRLENVQHSIIGDEAVRGISGGQKKRVNIGIELVSDPSILFCDEATSGLDSGNSLLVMQMLRKIAEGHITVITVIHQPREEIFNLFHEILLLGHGGRTIYHGETSKVLSYFGALRYEMPPSQNPADFLIDVVVGDREPVSTEAPEEQINSPIGLSKLLNKKLSTVFENPADRNAYTLFKLMDEDNSGRISYLELESMVRHQMDLSPEHLPESSIKKVWNNIDDDFSGFISASEFGDFMRAGERGTFKKISTKGDANSRASKLRAAKLEKALFDNWKRLHVSQGAEDEIRKSGAATASKVYQGLHKETNGNDIDVNGKSSGQPPAHKKPSLVMSLDEECALHCHLISLVASRPSLLSSVPLAGLNTSRSTIAIGSWTSPSASLASSLWGRFSSTAQCSN